MATKSPTKVITGKVRFSFLHVFEPHSIEEGNEKKYSAAILIPKKDVDTVRDVEAAIKAATEQGKEKFGKVFDRKLKTPLRDGDEERPDDPSYEGHWFLNASSAMNSKPTIVARDAKTILTSADEFYSGCYGRASLNFYPFSKNGNAGVAAGLNNLMKLSEGERLSGSSSAQADFADFAEGEDTGAGEFF
jgi:hypothetical protein